MRRLAEDAISALRPCIAARRFRSEPISSSSFRGGERGEMRCARMRPHPGPDGFARQRFGSSLRQFEQHLPDISRDGAAAIFSAGLSLD